MRLNVEFGDTLPISAQFNDATPLNVNFGALNTETTAPDYNALYNKPSINGVTLVGNKTSEDLNIAASYPEEGYVGDILMKTGTGKNNVEWVTPASSVEQDNTRPITAAAVYTEVGNINALLATI